jgi:hypothetical protein
MSQPTDAVRHFACTFERGRAVFRPPEQDQLRASARRSSFRGPALQQRGRS